jgi:hypothetical protein
MSRGAAEEMMMLLEAHIPEVVGAADAAGAAPVDAVA